jgi:hypothetical protein
MWLRLALVFLGTFLLLLGVGKAAWEQWSWGVLAYLQLRPALVGDSPRVRFRVYLLVASIGATLIALAILMP